MTKFAVENDNFYDRRKENQDNMHRRRQSL